MDAMKSALASPSTDVWRVLVADDHRDACDSIKMLLQSKGHETHAVLNGADAIREFTSFNPNLVLLDIEMPGMRGLEVAQVIRSIEATQEPIIAAMSWDATLEHKRLCAAAGFDHYLLKPVDPVAFEQLLWLVQEGGAKREKFLTLQRERTAVCYALSRSQLEFGGLVLDEAATSQDASARQRNLERVESLQQRMAAYLATEAGFSTEQMDSLQILLAALEERLGKLKRQVLPR